MKKDQYELDFEQQRKEIVVDEESDQLPSRTEIHQSKKNEKKSRTKLINVILVVFTLIPIGIFIYVISDLYSPSVPNQVAVEKTKVTVNNNSVAGSVNSDKPKEQTADSGDKSGSKSPAVVVNPDQPVKKQKEPASKPVEKPAAKPAEKPAVKPAVPEPKPEAKPDPKPAEKPAKPAGRTHVVKPNENLYRISVNYYGDGSHVQKIQQANGLSSIEITVGQTLILP